MNCSFNSPSFVCGSWKLSSFLEHSHTVPSVPWIPDTCVCVVVCYVSSVLTIRKKSLGMRREKSREYVSFSLIPHFLFYDPQNEH